ncbi:NAD(P)-binding protein [Lojkania enalia]|uniref:NAD(P)-binding protein n=1 Tax=Lojkania enalia TaxID=147567 RepID=A0A9P4N2W4_9PLEO|nr:NAD(P)-binding protein [Didymosphaeria enalia]
MTERFCRADGSPKAVVVTGGAGGIGAQTIRTFYANGCDVVIADLPSARDAAENLISSLSGSNRAIYHPTNIIDWSDMKLLFRETRKRFEQVDIVIANAGVMESKGFFDFEEDEHGELKEPIDAYRVIDVNLKGTMNSVVSYIASKHGVVGLCRSSQRVSNQLQIRVNVVAPFFTPTYITGSYSEKWKERGLPANTVEDVANAIIETSTNPARRGHSIMVAGKFVREIETARTTLTREWLGDEISQIMSDGGKFFEEMGGYPLPKPRK